ncbi:MAG TPA: helicase C-terminal domain-containing protein [Caldilineaceae bacterium]|nr:helicase C-terminal domain-containing protein [Caldilineaceae bacterium]
MAERIYVALDLETTGLDARADAIIEIGAVRFVYDRSVHPFGCRVLDHFVTFVNPLRPIPLRIQQLTGIRDADVAAAPTLDKVIPELLSFVTSDVAAVVAHNAGFDFSFLQAAGINFHRPVQDTFELASILLPGMASYNLGELCRQIEIALPEAHRALDDATAAANLFTYLLRRMEQLPSWLVTTLLTCGEGSGWPPLILLGEHCEWSIEPLRPPRVEAPPAHFGWDRAPDSLLLDYGPPLVQASAAELTSLFAADGPLSRLLGGRYEVRQGQQDMAQRVLDALNCGDHLLIEAGTGTGKSLGYLLPAALWSLLNQRRVVIATNTIALQDQLIEKDIPQVQALLASVGAPPLRAGLLKGRNNYLCTRRLFTWYVNRRLAAAELRVLARILVWLLETRSGDVGELFLPTAAERLIWSRLCSDPTTCTSERCVGVGDLPDGSRFVDFFLRARQAAESAHILVVNHALLLADIALGGRLLPPYSHLIVDEAHRLEEAATDQLGYRVNWSLLDAQLARLQSGGDLYQGIMQGARLQDDATALQALHTVAHHAYQTARGLRSFAQAVLVFAQNQEALRHDFTYSQRLGLDGQLRAQPAWSELEVSWDPITRDAHALVRHLAALVRLMDQNRWWLEEPWATLYHDLQGLHRQVEEAIDWLDRILFEPFIPGESDMVAWLEINEQVSEATLVAAPLFVNETLERELVHRKRSVIFTGATLRTGSGFSFIRDRLGLWDVTASSVDSPFDYRSNTLLYLPSDLPEPNQGNYQQAVEQAIIRAAVASSGATLALFTNYAQLRATAEAIRAPLDRLGITVLQHGAGSRQRLLREYRQAEKAVLLGARSFWEGIDLPGDELRCLLIVRLPFAVPTDPLVAARSAELENPFRDYTLPDAILRFRQGFGRLIRRASDRGIVVVLDSRVWRKEYGQAFLESLPECTTRHAPLANLDVEIDRWLRREVAADRVRN